MKPLEGIRVIELTQAYSGPFCGMMLADMGADIIKCEVPPYGDPVRYLEPGKDGKSTPFVTRNRGKKSVYMNLKDPRQKDLFKKMVKDADIIIENFKPGTMEKLGCGYDVLKEINPAIVLTSISGFGQTGPMKSKPAYDGLVQGESGFISVTGTKQGERVMAGFVVTDAFVAMTGCIGALGALQQAKRTGIGSHVDAAMLDAMVTCMESHYGSYFLTGKVPTTQGIGTPLSAPFSTVPVKDGEVFICVVNNAQWARFCNALGCPDMIEHPHFYAPYVRKQHEEELFERLGAITEKMEDAELCELLEQANIAYGHIKNVEEVANSQQFKARGMKAYVHGPEGGVKIPVTASPIKFSTMEHQTDFTAYPPGYHTIEIMSQYADEATVHDIYDDVLQEGNKASVERLKKENLL